MVGTTQNTHAGDGRGRLPLVVLGSVLLTFVLLGAPARAEPTSRAAAMRQAAATFLQRLDRAQRSQAVRRYDDAGRVRWSGFPGRRAGVAWRALNATQREDALTLLRTGLGERGMKMFEGVRTIEGVLREIESRSVRRNPDWRHPGLYHLAVFGSPTPGATWAWRIEGHHVSWTFTIAAERVFVTPRFQGANPATVRAGPHKGRRILGPEEDAARRFVLGLDEARRKRAIVSSRAAPMPNPSGNPDLTQARRRGITAGELSQPQRALLLALVDQWTSALHPELARAVREELEASKPERLTFAWMGGLEPSAACFYRLHGDTLHLEYGRSGNHIHSIWRDPRGDFGTAR